MTEPMVVVFIMFGVPIIGGLCVAAYKASLKHQIELARIRASGPSNASDLSARCEALEKRCEKLEAQVIAAHELLADERRELDRKLAMVLPEPAGNTGLTATAQGREERKTIN